MSCVAGFLNASSARSQARGDEVIFSEISAIQQHILDSINDGVNSTLSVVIDGGTPITSRDGILSAVVVVGGDDYVPATASVTIDPPSVGTGFVATATLDPSSGAVTGFDITDVGEGYEIGDVVTIVRPTGASGIEFDGEVSLVTTEASFNDDFSNDFNLHGSSSTTSGTAIGEVLGITINDPGTNYLSTPYIQLIDPNNTGSGCVLAVTLNGNNGVDDVTVLNSGENYSVGTAAVVVGEVGVGGEEAIVTVQTESGRYSVDVDAEYYHSVWLGTITDAMVKLRLDNIQSYFTKLGYNCIIQTNPTTMNTIQWYISW